MKSKFSIKTTIAIALLAVLCCVAIGGIVGWDTNRTYADDGVYYTLESVDVKLNDGWIITTNTPENMLYKMLTVTVTYKDTAGETNSYPLTLGSDGKADTGEQVVFSLDKGKNTITATVTPIDGDNYNDATKTGTLNYTPGDASQVEVMDIIASYDEPSTALDTSVGMSSGTLKGCITVYQVYNDGSLNNNALGTSAFSLSAEGGLFPTTLTQEIINGAPYNKLITVTAGGMSTTVLITGINFSKPTRIQSFDGESLAKQTARSKQVDISGLTIGLRCGNTSLTVPATAFPSEWFRYQYWTAEGLEVFELGVNVKDIQIFFEYPGVGDTDIYFEGIEVYRLEVDAPRFTEERNVQLVTIDWNDDGASLEISGWNYKELYTDTGDAPNPKLAVYELVDTSRNPVSDKNIVFDDQKYVQTVNFPKAGTYVVVATLPEEDDFAWGDTYNGTKVDPLTMECTVQVSKSYPELKLEDIDDVMYGYAHADGTVSAKLNGVDMTWSWGFEPASQKDAHKGDFTFAYHLEYYKSYTDKDNNVKYTGTLRSDGKPKEVGTYYVVAVSHENAGYYSVHSNAVQMEITPFKVSVVATGNDKEYERRDSAWTIADFLTFSPALPNGADYKETIYDVLAITDNTANSDTKGAVTAGTEYIHANNYSINIAVASGQYSNSYILVDSTSGSQINNVNLSFAITTYADSTFDFTASGWTYGATGANPNVNITSRSGKYYPSYTNTLTTDFDITYYKYDSSKPNHVGEKVTESDFTKWEVGQYVVELVAKADVNSRKETTDYTAGTTVDYVLPIKYAEFAVTASPIDAPSLPSPWVKGNDKTQATEAVYTYNDANASGYTVTLEHWIGDNVAVDGTSPIITITVSYITIVTQKQSDYATSVNGKFNINKAGYYIVTITLNANYSWNKESAGYVTDALEYSYVGFVARQQLTSADIKITNDNGVYSGIAQEKTVNGWNSNALKITNVTGVIIGGSTAINNGIVTPADNSEVFSVTNAGNYTVFIDIADQDNYEWADESDNLATIERSYTLNQAELKVTWDGLAGTINKSGDYPKYEFDGTKTSQLTPKATPSVAFTDDNGKLGDFTYTLYSDAFSTTRGDVTAIGHYYIAVTDFGGAAATNYRLSDTKTDIGTIFEIYAYKLNAPQDMDSKAFNGTQSYNDTYKGSAFDVTEYISNYGYYTIGNTCRIKVTVTKDGTETTALNADTYKVTISIADTNYVWADEGDYSFTFTIDKRTVEIEWLSNETIYDPDGNATPNYRIHNRVNNDELTLKLEYKLNGEGEALDLIHANAGVYTVYAVALAGDPDVVKNYQIVTGSEKGQSNDTATYTVLKRFVARPDLPSGENNDFNGVSGSVDIDFKDYYKTANVTIEITGKVPGDWFSPAIADLSIDGTTLKFAEGQKATFDYSRAGVYSFKVSLDATNYYWVGDDQGAYGETGKYSYEVEDGFTVNRRELMAPNIKGYREQEFNNLQPGKPNFVTEYGDLYTIEYYTVASDGDKFSSTLPGYADDKNEGILGTYYAKLIVKSSETILNYVWAFDNNDRNTGTGYLTGYPDSKIYSQTEVSIKIYYTITKGQLDIDVEVKGYVFGDNGYVNGDQGSASFKPAEALSTDANQIVHLVGDDLKVIKDIKMTIKDGTLIFKDSKDNPLSDEDLVNGLPWLAGDYSLQFELVFGDGETYANKTVSGSFTVAKRDIEVTWGANNFTYNAQEQIITATIKTLIQKDLEDKTDYTQGLTLVVELVDGGGKPTNAGTHNVKVSGIVAKEGVTCNFKLPDNDLTTTFEIKAKDVTVKGVEVSGHFYGDDIVASEKQFSADGFIDDDPFAALAKAAIKVLICSTQDGTTEIGRYANVGTYYVVVGWANNNVETYKTNYNVQFDKTATFEIIKRTLTVTWNNEAKSTYGNEGNDIDLYQYLSIISCKGSEDNLGDALAGKLITDIIKLVAQLKGADGALGIEEILGTSSSVGTYKITPSMEVPDNWNITFVGGESWVYNIENATITEENNSLTPQDLTYNAEEQNVFANPSVKVINNLDAMWEYGVVNSAGSHEDEVGVWIEITDHNIWCRDAGTYYFVIRITADNHNVFTKTVTVVIEKAELEVQLDFSIMYGEEDPSSESHRYLFDTIRETDSKWTVTGFMGSDSDKFYSNDGFYHLTGKAEYAIDGYVQGDFSIARQDYTVVYEKDGKSLFTLECTNYKFKLVNGTLTVNKIEITLTANSHVVSYNANEDEETHPIPDLTNETVAYEVAHPVSTYGSETHETHNYAGLINVSSPAFTNSNPTTKGVGKYAIEFTISDSDYYTIKVKGGVKEGNKYSVADKVEIIASTLDVNTIEDYNEQFDEQYHGLIVNGDDSAQTKVTFATASDGTTVKVEFYLADSDYRDVVLSESYLKQFTPINGVPTYIDRGTYRIVYKISAGENYNAVYGYNEIVISLATNTLKQQFAYTVGEENKIVSSNDVNKAEIAWTYGYEVTDGFYFKNVTIPQPTYTRAGASKTVTLLYQLTYYTDVGAVGSLIASGEFTGNIFTPIFEDGKFDAGYYLLRVYMSLNKETDNFTFTDVNYVFSVAKRGLTITAQNASTIYGEAAPEFTPVYTGLVSNGKTGKGTDSISDAIGVVPTFVTDYSVGDKVGTYRIYVDPEINTSTNYEITYVEARLTVNKREITVTINDLESIYNNTVYELTFKIASGSLDIYTSERVEGLNYDIYSNSNQKLLILKTDAIKDGKTNAVKYLGDPQDHGTIVGYTIYVVFYSDAVEENYVIKFASCTHKETNHETGAIGYDGRVNNAGTYTIKQASFDITQLGVHHKVNDDEEVQTTVYSGAVNYYKAYLDDPESTLISFTYERKDSKGVYQPISANEVVDVGSYRATGSSTNPNYTAGSLSIEFTITVAKLTLRAHATQVQYGTTLSGNAATDKDKGIVKEDGTGRFDGFSYTASSNDLLASVIEKYQNNTVAGELITYSCAGYSATTAVGTSNLRITPVCEGNSKNANIDIVYESDTLEVVARKVTVTIVGCEDEDTNPNAWCYYQGRNVLLQNKLNELYVANYASYIITNFAETFGDAFNEKTQASAAYEALCIKLTLPQNASNVDTYTISYSIDTTKTSNFDVTFTNRTDGAAQPQFRVEKAKLTLYAYDANYANSYSVTYGESIALVVPRNSYVTSDGKLRYSVSGMVDNQYFTTILGTHSVEFTVKCGSKDYEPWDSTVNEAYVVEIVQFDVQAFTNYVVETYVSANLKVTKRVIYASTVNQTFEFDGTNYNDGLYGKSHNAVITFADTAGNDQVNGEYRPGDFTLTYTTTTLQTSGGYTYQTAGKAPTVVGKYTVTVSLDESGNYEFSGGRFSMDLPFEVTKQTRSAGSLKWKSPSLLEEGYDGDEVMSNNIDYYQAGYMKVTSFVFEPVDGFASDVLFGSASQRGTYYFDEQGTLWITIDKPVTMGRYTVRIELKPTAMNNLELMSGDEVVLFVNLSFSVTSENVELTVEYDDFVYGDEPSTPVINVNGTPATKNITIYYELLTDSDTVKDLYENHRTPHGFTYDQISGLSKGNMSISPNFVAGYYLMYVQYRATNGQDGKLIEQDCYYIFKVEKKTIDVPAFIPEGVEGYFYNGQSQTLEIKYAATYMRPIFNTVGVIMDLFEGKVTFTVTNVNDYVVGFVLLDSANTMWSDKLPEGVRVDGNTATFTWTIYMDESENNPQDPFVSVTSGLNITYGGAFDKNDIAVKDGYEGEIKLYYLLKGDEDQPGVDAEWQEYNLNTVRLNAGSYWLKVVLTDLNKTNFSDKVIIGYFTITPREITATVSGEITYGDDLSKTDFKPVVDGLLSNDSVTFGDYSYDYAENYTLTAGGVFYIILKADVNGVVEGISAGSNYVIQAERGLLVVNKRNVTVNINTLSGYYAVTPDTSWITYSVGNLAPGEDKSVLKIDFVIGATAEDSVGGEYWITIDGYDDTNYVISYQRARYIVKTLEIEVSLLARQDMFYMDGGEWCVRIDYDNIRIPIQGDYEVLTSIIEDTLSLNLLYTGTSYGGIAYNSDEAPTNAGIYKAQVVGSSANYTLIGMPEIEFTINKQELDNTKLSIANQTYTGELLIPVITVSDNAFDSTLFDTSAGLPNSVNAGSYNVIVSILDHNNYQWADPLTPTSVTLVFTVDKADDEETTRLTINGWQYGLYSVSDNSPYAEVKSGGTVNYEYSIDGGKTYTSIVPDTGIVGTYYVRAVVAESTNYNAYVGEAVRFEITKHLLNAPTLTSNDNTYTSDELVANISVFDNRYMTITSSSARTFLSDDGIVAVTVGAGTYYFYVGLLDADNYAWADNAGNSQGVITLEWTVAKKKIDLPTAGKNSFVINHGNNIVYTPDGFDESLMTIEGNEYSYSGKFTAVIKLIDTDNYEWANGQDTVELTWYITGSESIFIAITVTLAVVTTAGITGIMVQLLLEKRRKRNEASAMRDIESKDANTDSVQGGEQ